MAVKTKYDTGLALSGGFIRGFAHLGVIQSLIEHDIRPDIISGVSAGALVGVLIADGNEPYRVLDFFKGLKFLDFTKPTIPRSGFFDLNELKAFLDTHLKAKRLEELPLPTIVTATDLDHGHSVHFTKGAIAERVVASCSMPILFKPTEINGTNYVDGGVLMNLPVSTLRNTCRRVVAVNVSPLLAPKYKLNMINIAERSYHFMSNSNTLAERDLADILIEPTNLSSYGNTKLEKAQEIFMAGYKKANETLLEYKFYHLL